MLLADAQDVSGWGYYLVTSIHLMFCEKEAKSDRGLKGKKRGNKDKKRSERRKAYCVDDAGQVIFK